jgi:hypothetical protein
MVFIPGTVAVVQEVAETGSLLRGFVRGLVGMYRCRKSQGKR